MFLDVSRNVGLSVEKWSVAKGMKKGLCWYWIFGTCDELLYRDGRLRLVKGDETVLAYFLLLG